MKRAPIFQSFDIQGNAGGVGIVIQPIDHVSKIDIRHIADRDQFIKADPAGEGGSIDGDQQSADFGKSGRLYL